MIKVNRNNGNKIKSVIFSKNIFKSNIIYFLSKKILKYFNDFQNQNFSVL